MTINQIVLEQGLVSRGDLLLAAVSGGVDSVVLLDVLDHLRCQLGIQVHVAHFNHRLRPGADGDEKFVLALAQRYGFPITVGSRRDSLRGKACSEDQARRMRLAFLSKTAQKIKANAVVLAHTQNDLAETVLMRMIRGCGLSGLRGILAERLLNGVRLIRPLLGVKRTEIVAYARLRRLKFRQDPTNAQLKFTRNKVRLDLLPLLRRQYNVNVDEVLVDLAQTASQDYDFLLIYAQKRLKEILGCHRSLVTMNLKKMGQEHVAVRRMLLRLTHEQVTAKPTALAFKHIRALEDLIDGHLDGATVHLPQGIVVAKKGHVLQWRI